jgi:serine/threonine protein kinase
MGIVCCRSSDVHHFPTFNLQSSSKIEIIYQKNIEIKDMSPSNSCTRIIKPIRWRRGNLIGQGMYGKVYQAMNIDTGELIAIKSSKLSSNPLKAERELMRIRQEIMILTALDHPNIIKYFQADYCYEQNYVDIILEYVPSGSMKDLLLKYKNFSEQVIKIYTKQLLSGLDYLHTNGVVHRDLKSANVLITEDSTLKLTDFGCCRKFNSVKNPCSKSFKGSPFWMAPEIVKSEPHGLPADIWSLGCLVIEMVTGEPPWSNYSKNGSQILKLISEDGNLPDIPQTSPELKEFILLCLQRDPNKRPTAAQLCNHCFLIEEETVKYYDIGKNNYLILSTKQSITSANNMKD